MGNFDVDSQEHALSCHKVRQHFDSDNPDFLTSVLYCDLIISPARQSQVICIFKPLFESHKGFKIIKRRSLKIQPTMAG